MFEALAAANMTVPATIPLASGNTDIALRAIAPRAPTPLGANSEVVFYRADAAAKAMTDQSAPKSSPGWLSLTQKRIGTALALSDGWDGPSTAAVDPNLAILAERLLTIAFEGKPHAKAPFIVPLRDGGLQVEWHTVDTEIELYLRADGTTAAWAHNRESGYEIEREGTEAAGLLLRWADRLVEKSAPVPSFLAT